MEVFFARRVFNKKLEINVSLLGGVRGSAETLIPCRSVSSRICEAIFSIFHDFAGTENTGQPLIYTVLLHVSCMRALLIVRETRVSNAIRVTRDSWKTVAVALS